MIIIKNQHFWRRDKNRTSFKMYVCLRSLKKKKVRKSSNDYQQHMASNMKMKGKKRKKPKNAWQ